MISAISDYHKAFYTDSPISDLELELNFELSSSDDLDMNQELFQQQINQFNDYLKQVTPESPPFHQPSVVYKTI